MISPNQESKTYNNDELADRWEKASEGYYKYKLALYQDDPLFFQDLTEELDLHRLAIKNFRDNPAAAFKQIKGLVSEALSPIPLAALEIIQTQYDASKRKSPSKEFARTAEDKILKWKESVKDYYGFDVDLMTEHPRTFGIENQNQIAAWNHLTIMHDFEDYQMENAVGNAINLLTKEDWLAIPVEVILDLIEDKLPIASY